MKQSVILLLTLTVLKSFSQTPGKGIVLNNPSNYRLLSAVHGGAGQMKFARLIGSQTLATNFPYLHAGEISDKAGIGQRFHHNIEEMYVVPDGEAEFTINGGSRLMPLAKPKAMVLQMDFIVAQENAAAFEKMYSSAYVPAMTVQKGYIESKLLRLYPDNVEKEIEGEQTTYNYQIQISFDTEENRRKWVASPQHKIAWPAATSLAKSYKWRGYEVMGDDNQQLKH